VRYSKLSMITATNRFSIYREQRTRQQAALPTERFQRGSVGGGRRSASAHQEGAEEDEGDKVAVGELGAAAPQVVWVHRREVLRAGLGGRLGAGGTTEGGDGGDGVGVASTFRAFARRFYPKRLSISTFVRRRNDNISLSVQ
jgi:hypothetical protein